MADTRQKLKWRVQPVPTGQYRSFATRGWPVCEAPSGDAVAQLSGPEAYDQRIAEVTVLTVRVADRSVPGPFKWRVMKSRPTGVTAAKAQVAAFFAAHPGWLGGVE